VSLLKIRNTEAPLAFVRWRLAAHWPAVAAARSDWSVRGESRQLGGDMAATQTEAVSRLLKLAHKFNCFYLSGSDAGRALRRPRLRGDERGAADAGAPRRRSFASQRIDPSPFASRL